MTLHGFKYLNYRKHIFSNTYIIYLSKRKPNLANVKGCNTSFLKIVSLCKWKNICYNDSIRSLSPNLKNIYVGYLTKRLQWQNWWILFRNKVVKERQVRKFNLKNQLSYIFFYKLGFQGPIKPWVLSYLINVISECTLKCIYACITVICQYWVHQGSRYIDIVLKSPVQRRM